MGQEDSHRSSNSIVKKLSKAVEVVISEVNIGSLPREPTREVVVPHSKEIALRLAEEPTVPTKITVSREEVLVTECPEFDEQRQAAEPQVEEQTTPGQSKVHVTQEMVLESRVLTKVEPTCPGEPSSPKIDAQEPLVPSDEETLKKILDERAPSNEPSLKEQQPEDAKM